MQDTNRVLLEFTGRARSFCEMVEAALDHDTVDPTQFLPALAKLYALALTLPHVSCTLGFDPGPESFQQQQRAMYKILQTKLVRNQFRMVFHPWEEADPLIYGSAADALAGIWCDLKRNLQRLDGLPHDRHVEMLWWFKFNFHSHWGTHAAELLFPLHALWQGQTEF